MILKRFYEEKLAQASFLVGCTAAVLYSLNRKATEFYARIGYREFGRVAVAPPGSSRIYMSKVLA